MPRFIFSVKMSNGDVAEGSVNAAVFPNRKELAENLKTSEEDIVLLFMMRVSEEELEEWERK